MSAGFDVAVAVAKALARELGSSHRLAGGFRTPLPAVADREARLAGYGPEEPLSAEAEAEGEWQDAVALRCHEYDPDAEVPHPGGAYWERLILGEAWR